MEIGKNIYLARKRKGISQEELANKLEVSRQSISLWETDQTTPTLDKMQSLCEILNITMDELVGNKSLEEENKISKVEKEIIKKEKLIKREKIFFYLSILSFLLWRVVPLGFFISLICILVNIALIIKKQRKYTLYSLVISIVSFIAAIIYM